MSKKISHS